jgi:hypothetical protein
VSGGRLSADLILVNLLGKVPEESLLIGQHIREMGEFRPTRRWSSWRRNMVRIWKVRMCR